MAAGMSLWCAAQQDCMADVQRLLRAHQFSEKALQSALNVAIVNGCTFSVHALLHAKADPRHTEVAARHGSPAIFKALLKAGACVWRWRRLQSWATQFNNVDTLQLLVEYGLASGVAPSLYAMCCAAADNGVAAVRLLLQAKVDPDREVLQGARVANGEIQFRHARPLRGYSALCVAVKYGHERIVAELLAAKASVNRATGQDVGDDVARGRDPLTCAIRANNIGFVRLLLEAKACANVAERADGTRVLGRPLRVASAHAVDETQQERVERDRARQVQLCDIIRLLVSAKARVDECVPVYAGSTRSVTSLCVAAQNGNLPAMGALLAAGADVDVHGPLLWTARRNFPSGMLALLRAKACARGGCGTEALEAVLLRGGSGVECVRVLVSAEATAPQASWTAALCAAVDVDDARHVRELVRLKAPVGNECIFRAVHRLAQEATEALLEAKADVAATDTGGLTCLHAAALIADSQEAVDLRPIVSRLVAAKASHSAVDRFGYTPLGRAIQYGHMGAVQVLLACKADPNEAAHVDKSPPHLTRPPLALVKPGCASTLALLLAKADVNGGRYLHALAGKGTDNDCQSRSTAAAAALLVGKADLEATDSHGRTALQCAVQAGNTVMVDWLLSAGASCHDAAEMLHFVMCSWFLTDVRGARIVCLLVAAAGPHACAPLARDMVCHGAVVPAGTWPAAIAEMRQWPAGWPAQRRAARLLRDTQKAAERHT